MALIVLQHFNNSFQEQGSRSPGSNVDSMRNFNIWFGSIKFIGREIKYEMWEKKEI